MRIIVFFDLPVKTKSERRTAAKFRKFLIDDGYHMLQYSLYARTCNGNDAVEKHKRRLYASLPDNGSVRMLVITEKQFQSIEILVGKLTACDNTFETEQLTLF
ncbi:MAG: CRISPR-associated endonuclease Cas2 [Oscillospiraceae bacterium]|nr:CRISPR-associated endonuclease Cas2 [Oscillospiraceae bacterium]